MTLLLTIDAVREWVGDFEIGKGRPYSESAAVSGCVRTGETLRASVKGSRTRRYRVQIAAGGGMVTAADCTCPVGDEGIGHLARCKHVAAVLLAYVEAPARFVKLGDVASDLASREKPALIGLVLQLLQRAPELEPLLAAPVPGVPSPGAAPTDFYFWQAMEVIRGVNLANDWAEREIADGLAGLLALGRAFEEAGQRDVSQAVFAGVTAALAQELSPEQRERVQDGLPDHLRNGLVDLPRMDQVEPPF